MPRYDGHFLTFLESIAAHDAGARMPEIDEHCPSLVSRTAPEKRCSKCKGAYVFNSMAEYTQHNILFHPVDRLKPTKTNQHKCSFKVDGEKCDLIFSTHYQLQQHKAANGHINHRKNRAK